MAFKKCKYFSKFHKFLHFYVVLGYIDQMITLFCFSIVFCCIVDLLSSNRVFENVMVFTRVTLCDKITQI